MYIICTPIATEFVTLDDTVIHDPTHGILVLRQDAATHEEAQECAGRLKNSVIFQITEIRKFGECE